MLHPMQPLNEAIAAVLHEVSRGCAANRPSLKPERIRVTLNFTMEPGQPPQAHANGPHSVTVELDLQEIPANGPTATATLPSRTGPANPVGVVPALSQVFGAPGFDSSARATVFRETFADRTPGEAAAIVAGLTTPLASLTDERTRQAVHILRGVILSGPAKQVERGAEILRQVFFECPLTAVMQTVESTWKTQDDWLD